ncbi:hypothetical protein ETB97_000772 [Aspergillus alliaceus]|uniref:Uncharacterized protein n=1 Tax=Petromyces alliaceus TaxID=209559 RepID=A0A8H6A1R3_PETAA|nr:hypothetical protein ETB97_000772 [Aspergillus burnettii]
MFFAFDMYECMQRLGLTPDVFPSPFDRIPFSDQRRHEADHAYIPLNTRSADDHPSLVFKFGHLDALHTLQVDARLWLAGAEGLTQLVLVIAFNKPAEQMEFECWELLDSVPSRTNRSLSSMFDVVPALPDITDESVVAFADNEVLGFVLGFFLPEI